VTVWRAGRSGVWFPARRKRSFLFSKTSRRAVEFHPASNSRISGLLSRGWLDRRVNLTAQFHLMPGWMHGATILLPYMQGPIISNFPATFTVLWVLTKPCRRVPHDSIRDANGFFRDVNAWLLWQCVLTFWHSHGGSKHVQEQDSHQPAANRKEQERERKICRLVIIQCGMRLQRARNWYVKRNQSLNVWDIIIIIIITILISVSVCNNCLSVLLTGSNINKTLLSFFFFFF
jgi:hypothetical protein